MEFTKNKQKDKINSKQRIENCTPCLTFFLKANIGGFEYLIFPLYIPKFSN